MKAKARAAASISVFCTTSIRFLHNARGQIAAHARTANRHPDGGEDDRAREEKEALPSEWQRLKGTQ